MCILCMYEWPFKQREHACKTKDINISKDINNEGFEIKHCKASKQCTKNASDMKKSINKKPANQLTS